MIANSDYSIINNNLDGVTGQYSYAENFKVITYPIEKYELRIRVSPFNEFLGVESISINKDFLSYQQKIGSSQGHDVEKFYLD